jgi:asparagine synthase (glutamine-hydrolysing)
MIGIYVPAQGRSFPEHWVQRFANSLAIGFRQTAQTHKSRNTLLAATHQPRGWLPPRTRNGGLVLFQGKVDNRAQIDGDLGRKFDTDSARYAAAWDAWGPAADIKLIGEFATILYDPEEGSVRLVRSPINAPPLYYYRDEDRIIVASTPRAVFATGEVAQEVDEQKIADTLFLNYKETDRGWFKGVYRIGTGTQAIVTADRVVTRRYYDLASSPDVRFSRDTDYVEAADALFAEATRAALDEYRKPAVSLSGGYDSQAVAAYALAARPGSQVFGYTGVPEDSWDGEAPKSRFADERPHVEALAQMHPHLVTEWVNAEGKSFDHQLQGMFLLGSVAPRNAMNLHWIHDTRARARAQGCDVMLTGSMGNATFSFAGDGMIADLFRQGRWINCVRESWHGRGNRSFARSFMSNAVMPNLPSTLWKAIQKAKGGKEINVFGTWCPMNPDWATEMRVVERALDMGYDQNYQPHKSTREWRAAVLGNAMNESGDIDLAMEILHGIPSRDPTSYRPLVEFCLSIPDDQFLRHGERRFLARRMLKGKVPDMVLDEKRRGLQAADWYHRIYRQKDELLLEIDRLAEDATMAQRLNLPALRKAVFEMAEVPSKDRATQQRLHLGLSRGLTTARFMRFVQGRNDG